MAVSMVPTSGTGPGNARSTQTYSVAGRPQFIYPFDVTFDSSYPTGGESIAATITNSPFAVLTTVKAIMAMPVIAPGGAGGENAGDILELVPDITNKKLLVFTTPATPGNRVQITSTNSLALITFKCIAIGYQ